MMKKTIIWRLKEQPTSESLRKLVKDRILKKEEAREILFNLEEKEIEPNLKVEELKSEIKFLRELVEKLADRSKIVKEIREIEKPYYYWKWWQPYDFWCTDNLPYISHTTCTGYSNPSSTAVIQNSQKFSDIKTF